MVPGRMVAEACPICTLEHLMRCGTNDCNASERIRHPEKQTVQAGCQLRHKKWRPIAMGTLDRRIATCHTTSQHSLTYKGTSQEGGREELHMNCCLTPCCS